MCEDLDRGKLKRQSWNVFAAMRLSFMLEALESEGNVPDAKEKAHRIMEAVKDKSRTTKNFDAALVIIREREASEIAEEEAVARETQEIAKARKQAAMDSAGGMMETDEGITEASKEAAAGEERRRRRRM